MVSHDKVGVGEGFLAAEYLTAVRDFALKKGVSVQALLENTGISVDVFLNPRQRVGDRSMQQLGVNLVRALDVPMAEAIEFGQSMAISSHGMLGVAVQSVGNLWDASKLVTQFMKTRISHKNVEVVDEGEWAFLRYIQSAKALDSDDEVARLFFDLSALVSVEQAVRWLLRDVGTPAKSRIHINRSEPDDFPHDILGGTIDVVFDKPYLELSMEARWLSVPIPSSDEYLAEVAMQRCDSELKALQAGDLIKEVQARLHANDGVLGLQEMASQLCMSVSTLQRRLKAQGTTYHQIKTTERLNKAVHLLANPTLSLEGIADTLGFSDASNFSKSFKSMMGCGPLEYRKQRL